MSASTWRRLRRTAAAGGLLGLAGLTSARAVFKKTTVCAGQGWPRL